MTELNKRFLTSLILLLFLFLSISNLVILFFTLLFCLYQIFYEFFNLLKKIYKNRSNTKLYFYSLVFLIFLNYTVIKTGSILYLNIFNYKIFLLLIISISVSSDIGGYIFGKIFKGKKLTKISPKKTYSGMVGSYLLSLIISLILFNKYISYETIIFMSLFVSSLTQSGDLFISFIKRKANLKDTGVFLPGHGGLLDRFDGLIFAIPIGLMIVKFL